MDSYIGLKSVFELCEWFVKQNMVTNRIVVKAEYNLPRIARDGWEEVIPHMSQRYVNSVIRGSARYWSKTWSAPLCDSDQSRAFGGVIAKRWPLRFIVGNFSSVGVKPSKPSLYVRGPPRYIGHESDICLWCEWFHSHQKRNRPPSRDLDAWIINFPYKSRDAREIYSEVPKRIVGRRIIIHWDRLKAYHGSM